MKTYLYGAITGFLLITIVYFVDSNQLIEYFKNTLDFNADVVSGVYQEPGPDITDEQLWDIAFGKTKKIYLESTGGYYNPRQGIWYVDSYRDLHIQDESGSKNICVTDANQAVMLIKQVANAQGYTYKEDSLSDTEKYFEFILFEKNNGKKIYRLHKCDFLDTSGVVRDLYGNFLGTYKKAINKESIKSLIDYLIMIGYTKIYGKISYSVATDAGSKINYTVYSIYGMSPPGGCKIARLDATNFTVEKNSGKIYYEPLPIGRDVHDASCKQGPGGF